MEEIAIKDKLSLLFQQHMGHSATSISAMPKSGSARQYFRLQSEKESVIGVYNADFKENKAFLSFTDSLQRAGVNVPKIRGVNETEHLYLLSDLGDMTLFEYIKTVRTGNDFPSALRDVYHKILAQLPIIQTQASREIDFSLCYPRAAFDAQSMRWDLNYFKYYFLKLADVAFDEQALENDFDAFINWLVQSKADYFLYRDFQSRNIMLVDGEPHFIDYQGGRKGALQYDIASLLYDAKADLPEPVREELLAFYLDELEKHQAIDRGAFTEQFYGFVLIRIMQAMGAYGYRGFFQRKEHFLQSIPYALDNMKAVLDKAKLPVELPSLLQIWKALPQSEKLREMGHKAQKLRVKIQSFSFKRGLPTDETEHGGGFIFDCRSIHNPGRYDQYKKKSGKDPEVIDFFAKEPEMHEFVDDVFHMADRAVAKYVNRKFNYISISFGCTGGQHRSVYCAERLAEHINEKFDVVIDLSHRETEYWKK